MENLIKQSPVWRYFYALTQIPRPSGHTGQVAQYLLEVGKSLSLESFIDQAGNVIIRKPASKGKENCTPVILQGHMDMVPQKNEDTPHDFTKDPIQTYIDGEWLKAKGTTLGADNGLGVAAALAILEDNTLEHGPLEVLITNDEETGMYGAFGLDPDTLKGKILLNLDSEHDGELFIGCAGGVDLIASWQFKSVEAEKDDICIKIELKGLKGGHSGLDINLERGNANKLLFRFLKEMITQTDARLVSVKGGDLRNAIPREASAILSIEKENMDIATDLALEFQQIYNTEYAQSENGITLTVAPTPKSEELIPQEIQDDLINAVNSCPSGVIGTNPLLQVVETSTNLGIVTASPSSIEVCNLLRSAAESKKEALASSLQSLFALAGAKVELIGSYPGWNPNPSSPILQLTQRTYFDLFGKEAKVVVVHAGLECGIIGSVYPSMDMISFGPTLCFPHSPDEKAFIPSLAPFYQLLTEVLKRVE